MDDPRVRLASSAVLFMILMLRSYVTGAAPYSPGQEEPMDEDEEYDPSQPLVLPEKPTKLAALLPNQPTPPPASPDKVSVQHHNLKPLYKL